MFKAIAIDSPTITPLLTSRMPKAGTMVLTTVGIVPQRDANANLARTLRDSRLRTP